MKYFYLIVFSILLSSCASSIKNKTERITLPKVSNQNKDITLLEQAIKNKVHLGEKNGISFDFFYGPSGSYFVVVSSKERDVNLSFFDASLSIDLDGMSPEVLSLALEGKKIYSGFGQIREGKTSFLFELIPVDPSMSSTTYSFPFSVKVKGF